MPGSNLGVSFKSRVTCITLYINILRAVSREGCAIHAERLKHGGGL